MRNLALVGATLAVAFLGAGALVGSWAARDLPDLQRLEDYRPPLSSVVLDRHGQEIGEFFAERRRLVSLDAVPRHVVLAFVASEDEAFFEHAGLDAFALARAAWVNLRAGGEVRQGGSTITQQLAKSLLLGPERTLRRKLRDILLALRIEERFSKQQILEMYLNQIYFGAGAYGIAEAARTYFAKDVGELSLGEAALLAGLPKAPSSFSPMRRPEVAEARRRWVLDRMLELGQLDAAAHAEAVRARPALAPRAPPPAVAAAGYFVEDVRQELFARLGEETVLRGGLRIETTLDAGLATEAQAALRRGLESLDARHPRTLASGEPPTVEGALVALDVASGEVLALVGGYDFGRSEFNRALQARRQPGSAFKPFVYGAALSAGFLSSGPLYDYQVEYALPGRDEPWRPRNHGDSLRGEVPMYEAFARSLNNATIRLLEEVGVRRTLSFARNAGIRSPLSRDLGLALGTSEVTLFEITSAYGTFAAGGRPLRPRYVRRVLDRDGRELLADLALAGAGPAPAGISPVDAYLVTHLLRGSVRHWFGTAHAAAGLQRPLAGKTGSTNEYRDAWFIGFSPELVAGVWVGRDDRAPLGGRETGARAALPIWIDFMQDALAGRPSREFAVPAGVQFAATDPQTGEVQRSARALAGFEPVAPDRPVRVSHFVAPPPPPEPFGPEPPRPDALPDVGAAPPVGDGL